MSRAWGEHDIEERTRVFFLSYTLALSFQGLELFSGAPRGSESRRAYSVLAQGSSPGSCGKREAYPGGQGHPRIPGPPAAGLSQASGSSHPGTTVPQACPEASRKHCGDTVASMRVAFPSSVSLTLAG